MDRQKQMVVAQAIASGSVSRALVAIDSALMGETGKHWIRDLNKLRDLVQDKDCSPRFSILIQGNTKLSFLSYSELPIVTCPGAGECAEFCYSLKAFRYPAAFCRMAQNTWLRQKPSGRAHIEDSFSSYCDYAEYWGETIDFRLFVDGDFADSESVDFWMGLIKSKPILKAYGYSKSFKLLTNWQKNGGQFPSNYTLNMSSGHNASQALIKAAADLPITRGDFIAVQTPTKWKNADYGSAAYNRELVDTYKAETGKKAFPCPGKCDSCRMVKGKNVHACGDSSAKMRGLDIIIAMH